MFELLFANLCSQGKLRSSPLLMDKAEELDRLINTLLIELYQPASRE